MAKLWWLVAIEILLCVHGSAHSQVYPVKSLRLIVPSAAGGGPDANARALARELGKQLHQHIVVENLPGASGILGYEALARATPDGYTFAYVSNLVASNPSLYTKLPYDFAKDFQPVMLYLASVNLLAVSTSLPVGSVHELIQHARAHPGRLTFGSSGAGATPHLSMELFKIITGVAINHVPYRGTPQALSELVAGQIDILCDNMAPMLPMVRAGRIRGLAVTSLQRSSAIPELPTLDESGLAGYQFGGWAGIAVPAGVPRAVVMRLNAAANKTLSSPELLKTIASHGRMPIGGTPEQFGEHVRTETERLSKLITAIGLKPQ